MRLRAALVGALIACAAGCGAPLSDDALADKGVYVLPVPKTLPSFALEDHTGARFDNASLDGKWTFVFFGFTSCPDICPTSLAQMGRAETELLDIGGEVADAPFQGVLVSVDLERDGPEQLAAYMSAFSPRFLGVNGALTHIGRLADALGVDRPREAHAGEGVDQQDRLVTLGPRDVRRDVLPLHHDHGDDDLGGFGKAGLRPPNEPGKMHSLNFSNVLQPSRNIL